MFGIFWMLLPSGFPARWLGALMLLPMFMSDPNTPSDGTLRLFIFDVGQGLAVAAQTKNHALLYDTGPDFNGDADSGNRILVPALRGLGIAQLDGLILTHDDIDHTGGAASVMQAIPIQWVSGSLSNTHPLLMNSTHHQHCIAGQSWHWDGINFEVLHPTAAHYAQEKIKDNDLGCVLRISNEKNSILLATDIEKKSEKQLIEHFADKLPATLLIVPHHGSKTSSTPDFIAAVHPRFAVFTVGYRNRFHHPNSEVIERYREAGSELLRSDEDGLITINMRGESFTVEKYRQNHARYWQSKNTPLTAEEKS
jgi:competence protein ComEC